LASLTKSKDLYEGDSFRRMAIRESWKNGDPQISWCKELMSI